MKKIISMALCVMMLCLFSASALAAVNFSWDSDSTSFSRWSSDTTSDGPDWYLNSWTSSNLSASHKAGVKIYTAPGKYASHTFYYSSTSTSSHDYLPDFSGNAYAAGMRYSGSGNITVAGKFNP